MPVESRMPGESLAQYARRIAWLHRQVEVGQPQPESLAKPWGEWLKQWPWESWGTLTFRDDGYSHEAATRSFNRFTAWLRAEGNDQVSYFVGHEVGKQGRLHLHCLLGSLAPMTSRRALWQWWFERYGRCELRGYDPEQGAAVYVSKYVTKELAHYDLDLEGMDRWHSDAQLLSKHTTERTMRDVRRALREKQRSGTRSSERG